MYSQSFYSCPGLILYKILINYYHFTTKTRYISQEMVSPVNNRTILLSLEEIHFYMDKILQAGEKQKVSRHNRLTLTPTIYYRFTNTRITAFLQNLLHIQHTSKTYSKSYSKLKRIIDTALRDGEKQTAALISAFA